jgi:hypothetical protein
LGPPFFFIVRALKESGFGKNKNEKIKRREQRVKKNLARVLYKVHIFKDEKGQT